MKTTELIGPALDWAVAKCEENTVSIVVVDGSASIWSNEDIYNYNGQSAYTGKDGKPRFLRNGKPVGLFGDPMPSYLDWEQGGPIIERENITLIRANSQYIEGKSIPLWFAETDKWVGHNITTGYEGEYFDPCFMVDEAGGCYGPTPLIAAMRCYVTSKLGDEIEIPEELK